MTTNVTSFTLAALVVLTSLTANAVVVPHAKTIVVESPETHQILAEANPEAMYLHDTNDGRTLLYIEAENGRKSISLDVSLMRGTSWCHSFQIRSGIATTDASPRR